MAENSRSQAAHCSRWLVTARISAPLTRPSRYGENSFFVSAQFVSACFFLANFDSVHFMVSPQPLCHHANSHANLHKKYGRRRSDTGCRGRAALARDPLPGRIRLIFCAARRGRGLYVISRCPARWPKLRQCPRRTNLPGRAGSAPCDTVQALAAEPGRRQPALRYARTFQTATRQDRPGDLRSIRNILKIRIHRLVSSQSTFLVPCGGTTSAC